MGITAKPFGRFASKMRKIKNKNDAEAYTIKHMATKAKEGSLLKELSDNTTEEK